MQFDFPTVLFFAVVASGLVWAADALWLAPRRRAHAAAVATGDAEARPAPREPVLVEYARSFFPILLAVLVLRSFLVEPFRIPSGSMMPTLLAGDFILVNKFAYGIRLPVINAKVIDLGRPERGDVVVFRYPRDPSVDYIKRVVGLPGDRIEYRDKQLYVNGRAVPRRYVGEYENGARRYRERLDGREHDILLDPYPAPLRYPCLRDGAYVVPEGHYFVMGDNRDNSNDSRFWCAVPDRNLVGKAFLIWMNWSGVDEGLIRWRRIGRPIH
ncbi:signal peptidase I [Inmirania thermothiophila]|uniref:Signal peptidase I n=1 Tax=Inmirania thermothiophila TaxID=1750597 RepID=A0A3N1XZY1_9GAMM|nr:signal peptidase I [Inmirania thermothiophila]ROR32129.1 signal peptidase I [Inmirania thermothiophila]